MRGERLIRVRTTKPDTDNAQARRRDAQARREFVARERAKSGGSPWRGYRSLQTIAERDGPPGN